MASLYKTHLREMLDKFLREGTSLAESHCEPTKEGFLTLYQHCAQEVRKMSFTNSILALHTVEAMQWRYLWVEPFAYEVPELQKLYMEWRDNDAEAKAFLDAVCAGLPDPSRILPAPFIFRGAIDSARETVKAIEAPKPPPNTRATSPVTNADTQQCNSRPASPPKHGFTVEYDENKENQIKSVLSRLVQLADVETGTPKETQLQVSKYDEKSAQVSTRILRSKTSLRRTFFLQDGTPRVVRTPCKPRASLDMTSTGKVVGYRSPVETKTIKQSPKESPNDSPNAMRGIVMTSPPRMSFAIPVVDKRKFQPENKDTTPSNGYHLQKKTKPNSDGVPDHLRQEFNLKSAGVGVHYNLRKKSKFDNLNQQFSK